MYCIKVLSSLRNAYKTTSSSRLSRCCTRNYRLYTPDGQKYECSFICTSVMQCISISNAKAEHNMCYRYVQYATEKDVSSA
jgi:hypothetical protein